MKYKKEKKVPLTNIDPTFIEGMSWVQSIGDQKHADSHWKDGVSVNDIIGGIKRHITALERGDYFDKDSTLQHTYHAACGLMYISHYVRNLARYQEFFDQPFGRPPKFSSELGGPSAPREDGTGRIDKAIGGDIGVVQGPDLPGGTGGRRHNRAGLVPLDGSQIRDGHISEDDD